MNGQNKDYDFIVRNPKAITNLGLFDIGFIVAIQIFFTFISGPSIAMYVCFNVLFTIPGIIIIFAFSIFRIRVKGSKIYVRTKCGIKYMTDISEIFCVEIKTTYSKKTVNTEVMTIYVYDRWFKVERVMENSGKMFKYILDNVDKEKIVSTRKNFR